MTVAEKRAAALSDPDARPLTEEDMRRMKRTPRVEIIRRALGINQEEFAGRHHIPIGTLRDWEQGAHALPTLITQSGRAHETSNCGKMFWGAVESGAP